MASQIIMKNCNSSEQILSFITNIYNIGYYYDDEVSLLFANN